GGYLTGKFTGGTDDGAKNSRRAEFDFPPINKDKADQVVEVMKKIAGDKNVSVAQIALAWLLHQGAVTSVIIGARTKDQLIDNLESVNIELTQEELENLDEVSTLAPEYPGWMFESQGRNRLPEED
ncbi:MAG: aldo/keto reductase, partial [Bacteroidales bacterium]